MLKPTDWLNNLLTEEADSVIPELKLFYGVFFQLIADLQANENTSNPLSNREARRVKKIALEFINEDYHEELDPDSYITFDKLCEVLNLNKKDIIEKMLKSGAIPDAKTTTRGLAGFVGQARKRRCYDNKQKKEPGTLKYFRGVKSS